MRRISSSISVSALYDGENGENSVRIDLDNENDSVLYDGAGNVVSAIVTSQGYLYDGIHPIISGVEWNISSASNVNLKNNGKNTSSTYTRAQDQYACWINPSGLVTVNGVKDDAEIVVTAKYQGITHSAKLSVKRLNNVDKYDLVITPNSVPYNESQTWANKEIAIQVYRTPADGGTRHIVALSDYASKYTLTLSNSAGATLTDRASDNSKILTLTKAHADAAWSDKGSVVITLMKGGIVVDSESIPINKCKDGENSVRIDLDNENDSMLYDENGNLLSGKVYSIAYLFDGHEDKSSSTTWKVTPSGCTRESAENNRNIVISGMTADAASVTVEGTYTDGHGVTFVKTAKLTLKKIVGEDKYDLTIKPNAISFNTSESWTTKDITISADKLNSKGEKTTGITLNSGGVYLAAYYKANSSSNAAWSQNNGTFSVTEAIATANTEILFELRKVLSGKTYNINDSSTYSVEDYETVPIAKVLNGTSPWIADFDNEMDSVSCDDTGYVVSAQNVSTVLSLFLGATLKGFGTPTVYRNGTSMNVRSSYSSSGFTSGVQIVYSSSTRRLYVYYSTAAQISGKDDFTISITPTEDSSITRTLHFIVNGVIGDVYNLKPSVNEIKAKFGNGSYVVGGSSTYNLTCGYTKKVNGVTTTPSTNVTGIIDSKYNIYFRRRSRSTQTFEPYYQLYYSSSYKSNVTSLDIDNYDAVEFSLSTNTETLLTNLTNVFDVETVYVLSDGGDAAYVELSRQTILYEASSDGGSIKAQTFPITYALKVGGVSCSIDSTNDISIDTSGITPTNGVTVVSGTKTTSGCSLQVTHTSVVKGMVIITITGKKDGVSYTASASISVEPNKAGNDGNHGESYRFSFNSFEAKYNSDTKKLNASFVCTIVKNVGGSDSNVEDGTIYYRVDNGSWKTASMSDGIFSGSYSDVSLSNAPCVINFEYDDNDGSERCTDSMPISVSGTKGEYGHVGRFYYYAGDWNWSTTYRFEKSQAPFVRGSDGSFYMLDFADNEEYQQGDTTRTSYNQNPTSESYQGGKPWTKMDSTQQYYIAKAFFGSYAQFGSAIINGDWMLSTNGKINGLAANGNTITGKTHNGEDFSVASYTLFEPSYPHGDCEKIIDSSTLYTLSSTQNTREMGSSVYLSAGVTYYLSVTGRHGNSDMRIRIYNSTYGACELFILNSTTDTTKTAYFRVTTSAWYYVQMYCPYTGYYGYVTKHTLTRLRFAPNYAVDLKSGVTYQERVYASGGMRSPFTYLGAGGSFTEDFSDNIGIYSGGSYTQYYLPWTVSQSGRKVTITNYYYNGNESYGASYAKFDAPEGKYFYEDGIQKSTIKLSREAVELLGYGDSSTFYGWIVLKRIDLGTESRYGHHMKALAVGRVIGTDSTSTTTIHFHTFDGTTLTVERLDEGKYKVSWDNDNWFKNSGSVFVMICGYGTIYNGSNPLYASILEQTSSSFTAQLADDTTRNDGSFSFFLMNFDDWIYLV